MTERLRRADGIGPDLNGLATAIIGARAGRLVEVFAAKAQAGAKRSYTHGPKRK
jgi:phytoene dehydrogenase-like protein